MSNLGDSRVKLKLNNYVLARKIFSTMLFNFILNLYIVYELNAWPRDPANNFPLKNCLFGTFKLVRNADKSKFIYNGQKIAFDGASCHTDNRKNNFSVLGEGLIQNINDSTVSAEKKIGLILINQVKKFA